MKPKTNEELIKEVGLFYSKSGYYNADVLRKNIDILMDLARIEENKRTVQLLLDRNKNGVEKP